MKADELPGCCALRVVHELDCLAATDAYSKAQTALFETMPAKGIMFGANCTASILTLAPNEVGQVNFNKQAAFVKSKGFKLLGKWKNEYGDWIYLYGSKEFK
jgi:hypothetical protein